jgi:hypothetical protein
MLFNKNKEEEASIARFLLSTIIIMIKNILGILTYLGLTHTLRIRSWRLGGKPAANASTIN